MGCAKIVKQYRMCTHMMLRTHRYLYEDEKDDAKMLHQQYMYQHRRTTCRYLFSSSLIVQRQIIQEDAYVSLVQRTPRDCSEYAHYRKWKYTFTNTQALFGYDIRLTDVFICCGQNSNSVKLDIHYHLQINFIQVNDDTPSLIEFYLTLFQQGIMVGNEKRQEKDSSD
ncbi:unnamed protein product [Rotaria socialis]|uniref:Uncharacterized protein n=1 Tax=Rotaria socialis TaxID=392032 RepID=A0A821CZK0_9BILA|nr:unnamed protein product [Rotaria socialis]